MGSPDSLCVSGLSPATATLLNDPQSRCNGARCLFYNVVINPASVNMWLSIGTPAMRRMSSPCPGFHFFFPPQFQDSCRT